MQNYTITSATGLHNGILLIYGLILLFISQIWISRLFRVRYNQKTWGCSHVQHPDVLVHNMGMFLMKTWGCFES